MNKPIAVVIHIFEGKYHSSYIAKNSADCKTSAERLAYAVCCQTGDRVDNGKIVVCPL